MCWYPAANLGSESGHKACARIEESPSQRGFRQETCPRLTYESVAHDQIKWREGTNDWLSSRFARVRVAVAPSKECPKKPKKEWLLIEWPKGEAAPTKYWLSTLPETISFIDLVDATKLRWRIERDYQELKQEVGLGHYEGRKWRGFHHHASMCIAAYGFMVSERETIPPSGPRTATLFQEPAIPDSYRPRGSALAA